MTSEKDKMISGAPYMAADPQLVADRLRARQLCHAIHHAPAADAAALQALQAQLLPGQPGSVQITPPFHCDYGYNIFLGEGVYFNFNCVVLDGAPVRIGARTLCAPGVQIYTASHPLSPEERATGVELCLPVTIGEDVWIGGGAIICPGVTIGDGAVIGAGSVVTRDVPARVLAAGNPCRVVRPLDPLVA
ncbi:sugar O-acetyltransferase [Acidovorax sp. sif1233]|uniref:sugar O-acetyltransferase n=1 Tax=unclassified Acidovorax TaxID=2684926 RepID=UPI001C4935FD|nr:MULTISPECIES: sugar O-acetyltransferase [unclassified Acidovorax]MBV7427113.1 sugar O-acetyltransferase [Acidovorax sp. sif0732]MBV7448237.1 sugar O-acetyltransferase [Acidovorax sp. sif0715]MBV7454241.1 sugar O-acetyltransferase [Acidovorax sp. sif1233]